MIAAKSSVESMHADGATTEARLQKLLEDALRKVVTSSSCPHLIFFTDDVIIPDGPDVAFIVRWKVTLC